ncbi:hypothetical protein F5Y12DRAFT_660583 [Xylaria sp. FL1777]|nr:hypothetical protein F5Y12DRAFT_660583 [Xylaria sp. FL1777]
MEPYSGLEVVSPGSALPEAVPMEYKNYNIQTISSETGLPKTNLPKTDLPTPPSHRQDARKIYGLPVRSFYVILATGIILVIGAIAGGIAGGLASSMRHDHNAEPDPSSNGDPLTDGGNLTDATNSYILPTSKLSASNWTDPNGYTHRFVFFQDISSAIVARRWDAQNRTWNTNNLTDIFRMSRYPINPLGPSTPLASASLNFNGTQNQINLWYMAPDNTIASVEVGDLVDGPEDWIVNTLNDAILETYPGSQLAAAWNRCWGSCAGYWALAYQRPGDAGINVANGSDFSKASLAINSNSVVVGSSLALTPEVQPNSASVSRLTMMSESLLTSDSGKAYKSTYKTSWSQDGVLLSGATLPAPSPRLQFAITLLDNFRTIVFLALLPNGTVTGSYYRQHFVAIPSVDFRGGPSNPNFTAIATSEEAIFYGISQDEINQYSVNDTDPSVFEFVERVFP